MKAKTKYVFNIHVGVRRSAEEVLPELGYGWLSEYTAPSGAERLFSKMQLSLISCIIPVTSCLLKAS